MNESWYEIHDTLPLELISRTLAYEVDSSIRYSCYGFLYGIYQNSTRTTELCDLYPMDNTTTIQFYINATWWGINSTQFELFNKTA